MDDFTKSGSDLSGQPVTRWLVSSLDALPGGTSSPSISPMPIWAGAHIFPSDHFCDI